MKKYKKIPASYIIATASFSSNTEENDVYNFCFSFVTKLSNVQWHILFDKNKKIYIVLLPINT